jgi:hypothetical protein
MRPLLLHASSSCVVPKSRRVIHLEFAAAELPHGLDWHDRVPPNKRIKSLVFRRRRRAKCGAVGRGESLHTIGRAFGKEHSSIRCLVSRNGRFVPVVRRRALGGSLPAHRFARSLNAWSELLRP